MVFRGQYITWPYGGSNRDFCKKTWRWKSRSVNHINQSSGTSSSSMHSQASALQKSINFTILIPLIKKSQLLYHGYFHVWPIDMCQLMNFKWCDTLRWEIIAYRAFACLVSFLDASAHGKMSPLAAHLSKKVNMAQLSSCRVSSHGHYM